ncbi:hypothetical protein AGMMS50293_10800 [Spirochaetia bacterium]|nr:hypothetical protein AGMMS50293_10800 [Spirochaetia bacterium]
MVRKGHFLLLLLGALLGSPLAAATVSFMVVETGLPVEAGANQYSGLWESGLLDVFFEAGHIVSNAPVLRLYEKSMEEFPEEAREELNGAVEGGAEYFILAMLDYDAANLQKPRNISLRLFRTNPYKKLYEQQYADQASRTLKDEYDNLKKVARGLVSHLNDR